MHRLVRAAHVYTFHNSGCIYHDQKTAALGRSRNSINSPPLVENGGGESPVKCGGGGETRENRHVGNLFLGKEKSGKLLRD